MYSKCHKALFNFLHLLGGLYSYINMVASSPAANKKYCLFLSFTHVIHAHFNFEACIPHCTNSSYSFADFFAHIHVILICCVSFLSLIGAAIFNARYDSFPHTVNPPSNSTTPNSTNPSNTTYLNFYFNDIGNTTTDVTVTIPDAYKLFGFVQYVILH